MDKEKTESKELWTRTGQIIKNYGQRQRVDSCGQGQDRE
jgi:hypothetical protein